MANHKSAIKRARQNEIRRLRNKAARTRIKKVTKSLRLAAGLSNPEIADELVVAVSTVRSHCKSIYGKLSVHSRWDAVQRGRELGLLG